MNAIAIGQVACSRDVVSRVSAAPDTWADWIRSTAERGTEELDGHIGAVIGAAACGANAKTDFTAR